MDLSAYERKYVRIRDIYGETFTGLASYGGDEFLMHEYGGKEDGLFVEDCLIYRSQIASVEEIEVHGTAELWTEQLILRRYCPEDAEPLYRRLGTDPALRRYTGQDPWATPESARETVRRYIGRYDDERFYAWVMDADDVLVGTIEAPDYRGDSVGVGFRVVPQWQGRGCATEALVKVLAYLTENEGIPRVTARCAAENIAARRVLEKAGMRLAGTETAAFAAGGGVYDRLIYAYRRPAGVRRPESV